jgi:hypothetical protein
VFIVISKCSLPLFLWICVFILQLSSYQLFSMCLIISSLLGKQLFSMLFIIASTGSSSVFWIFVRTHKSSINSNSPLSLFHIHKGGARNVG